MHFTSAVHLLVFLLFETLRAPISVSASGQLSPDYFCCCSFLVGRSSYVAPSDRLVISFPSKNFINLMRPGPTGGTCNT